MVAGMIADMGAGMVADKVAGMVADMAADKKNCSWLTFCCTWWPAWSPTWGPAWWLTWGPTKKKLLADMEFDMVANKEVAKLADMVVSGHVGWVIGPKLFRPEPYPFLLSFASLFLEKLCFNHFQIHRN